MTNSQINQTNNRHLSPMSLESKIVTISFVTVTHFVVHMASWNHTIHQADVSVAVAKSLARTMSAMKAANARSMSNRITLAKRYLCQCVESKTSEVSVRQRVDSRHRQYAKMSALMTQIVVVITSAVHRVVREYVHCRSMIESIRQLFRRTTIQLHASPYSRKCPRKIYDPLHVREALPRCVASLLASHHPQSHGNAAELR